MTELTTAQQKASDLAESYYKVWVKADAALKGYEDLKAAADAARTDLEWAMTHPALPQGWHPKALDQPAAAEAAEEKPKRTRRTKAQIEADKAAAAAPAPAVDAGGEIPAGVETITNETGEPEKLEQVPSTFVQPEERLEVIDNDSEIVTNPQVTQEAPAPAPAPAPAQPAPAPSSAFNPFGGQL